MRANIFAAILQISALSVCAVTIPFDPSRGIVDVEVVLDGRVHGRFAIDTGADRLYIDKKFADKNKLNLTLANTERPIRGASGESKAYPVSLSSFEIGGQKLENIKATAVDLAAVGYYRNSKPMDGYIGSDILRQIYVTLDFPNGDLTLDKTRPQFLNGTQYETIGFKNYKHLILVDVLINDMTTVPMILDYGATHVVFTPKTAKRLGLSVDTSKRQHVKKMQIGDKVLSKNVAVSVGDLSRLKRAMPRAKFDGIIGATFLKDFTITVDYKLKRIYVRR